MNVRVLTVSELPEAVKLAQGVFNYCLRRSLQRPEDITYFEEYTQEENLRTLMEQGRLTLWGSFEMGHMVAMSAMQREGHITLLYVLPVYQRRGYGKMLLRAMRIYAGERFGLSFVTVNAMPPWTSRFFQNQGFGMENGGAGNPLSYVPMRAKTIHEVHFATKPVPAGWLIGTTVGGLGLSMVIAAIYIVSTLV
ncbi:MAG: GNAT family N-acetyltransferase [Muribaculaceae bacterium]|nr:GNAT family N-acetyltransferase [Roseburia sp.]MCM1431544.1 GNAT family N-acetyltransferase [Muribaculaceae bacterium]MCM1492009.1 GNAT family N-acetyltransferase [Muribaculaceae bacterium]